MGRVAGLDVSFSDFQFFSFPVRIGVVKIWHRHGAPDIPLSLNPGTVRPGARMPTSGTVCPALGRSRHEHAPAPVARPSPHAATVLAVRYRLGRHKDTTRCATLFCRDKYTNFRIEWSERVRWYLGFGLQEMGPPENHLEILNSLCHKQSEPATVNH